jgi:tyrosine-protein phosphatase YwqE
MTSFLSKLFNSPKKGKHHLKVDIHSHLIPGIDDGVKTTYESIKFIRQFRDMGYEKLIITPHIMWHRFQNDSETILEKLEFLRDSLQDHEIDMHIEAAAEYYLDDHFMSLLERREILTFHEKYLLFEMSYTNAPKDLTDIVFEIEKAGYQPVLAHPERYLFMHQDFEEYEALKDYGVLFQLNINSLAGYYNKEIQKIANKIVDRGMVDFLGSDTHKESQVALLNNYMQTPAFQKIFEKNKILNNELL